MLISKTKKCGAICALAFALFAKNVFSQEFTFTNELSSDIVTIDKIFADDENDFAGISEKASLEFTSEKVDAGLDLEFTLGTGTGNETSKTDHLNFTWTDIDFFLEFRPIEFLGLGFHEDAWLEGSYLPIWDDNVETGALGSSGFTLFVRPIEGLTISGTIPFDALDNENIANFLNGKESDGENDKFNLGFGAEYVFDELFSIGAKVNNVADGDEISFGVFGMIRPTKSDDIVIRAGFSHGEGGIALEGVDYSENVNIAGENIYNVSAELAFNALSVIAEIAGDTDKDDEEDFYDIYIGAEVGYEFTEVVSATLGAQFFFDFASDGEEMLFGIAPCVNFALGDHEFSAGVSLEFCDGDSFVKFPISWVYSF